MSIASRKAQFGLPALFAIAIVCPTVSSQQVFWTDFAEDKIQRANPDGSALQDLITTDLEFPEGIAIDAVNGKIYWADAGTRTIRRADMDGSNIVSFDAIDNSPSGIALDIAAGKIYWGSAAVSSVHRANLDGTNVELLLPSPSEGGHIRGIALDPVGGKMYIAGVGFQKVQRANLDGTHLEDLISAQDEPLGIALDIDAGKMYFSVGSAIQRANLDGTAVETVLAQTGIVAIALDVESGKMYWTSFASPFIQRANLDGTEIEPLVTTDLFRPRGIALNLLAPPLPIPGDTNCDGIVSVADIGPFVIALTDPAGYAAAFPDCDINNADINADGFVSVADIGPFVALLTG